MRSLAIAAAASLLAAAPQDRYLQPDRAREKLIALTAATDERAREEAASFFDPFPATELMRAEGFAAREDLATLEACRRALPHPTWRMILPRATIGEARKKQRELLGPDAGKSRADFTRSALALLDRKEPETRALALRLLMGIRVDDVGPLLPLLADPDPRTASAASGLLRRSGSPEAAKALRARWEAATPQTAWEAAQAVADTMSPDELPAILEQVRADPSRANAVIPLVERIGDARGEAFVASQLPTLEKNLVYGALEYLASVGGKPSIDAIRAFRDGLPPEDPRREWCLHALARLRASGAAKELLDAVAAGRFDLGLYADRFAALGDASVVPGLRALVDAKALKIEPRKKAVGLIGLLGGAEQLPFLLEELKSEKFAPAAAEALGEIGDPRAAGPLAAALRGARFDHEFGPALLSLSSVEGAEEALLEILGDPGGHTFVVEPAALVAARLRSPRARARLLDLLAGKVEGFRPSLKFAWKLRPAFGAADVADLRKTLAGAEESGRPGLALLLTALGDEAAARRLVTIVKEDRFARWAEKGPSVLCALQPPPAALLEEATALFEKDPKWFDGAELLAYAGKPAGLALLREALKRGAGFEEGRAARALLTLGDRDAVARIATLYLAFRVDAEEEVLLGPALDEAWTDRFREVVWSNLSHGNHPVVRVLAHRGDPGMRDYFRVVLRSTISSNDPHPQSNDPAVALSLARSGDRAVKDVFLRWLRSTSAGRRALAARCLALLGDRDAVGAVAPLLDDLAEIRRFDPDETGRTLRVRDAAVDALGTLLGKRFEGSPAERAKLAREALPR